MAWVRFSRVFNWTPPGERRSTIRYPAGPFSVTRDCAQKAVEAGAAERIKTPKRGEVIA